MKAKLLLALLLLSAIASATPMPGLWFIDPAELPPMEGYIEILSGRVNLELGGETARELYTWLPGSSMIRPDKICSRGLKVPPTVKRVGGVRCERYVHEAGEPATYKCVIHMDIATGRIETVTEEHICGLPTHTPLKTPEEEEEDFQKILNGAPPIGYPLVHLNRTFFKEKTPLTGNGSTELLFSGETAKMLYEAMPKNLTVPRKKACTAGEKIRPTIRRTNSLRCLRTPSADKKSATYGCYMLINTYNGQIEVASEEVLCGQVD